MDHQTSRSPSSSKTNRAIQDLIKSCRAQFPDGSDCQSQSLRYIDVQHACDELLSLTFHSDDGRRQVIEKLTTLNGNFVLKIIRKGLVSLSKVYSDSKTIEEESLNLVDLCCSQLHCLKRGCQNERLVASPAAIINWTSELCDELMSNDISSTRSIASLSSSVSKIKDLYENILSSSKVIREEELPFYRKILGQETFTFEGITSILTPRIHSEGFEDVIEQTAAILKTDVKTKPFICAILLSKWLELLKVSFVTNWFAAQVAKNDFVVHCESTKEGPNVSGTIINENSLICQVFDAIESLMSSDDKYEWLGDKERLTTLFKFPEVFLLRPKACIRLIQSREVCTKVIEDIFSILADKLNKDAIEDTDPYHPSGFNTGVEDRARKLKLIDEGMGTWSGCLHPDHKKISLNAITQALLTFPDKQQVLKIVQIWKHNFPDDISHRVLSELFILVLEVIEMKKETMVIDMEQLVIFLPELCTKLKDTLPIWLTLLPSLIDALPNSWYHPENLNLMKTHVNKIRQINKYYHSLFQANSFLVLLKNKSLSEIAKTKIFHLGLELLGEMNYARGCSEFSFYLILSLLSVMEIDQIRQYSLELLMIVKEHDSSFHSFNPIISIIVAVRNSRVIERKQEILEDLLKLLKGTRKDNESAMLIACREFLKFSVNTENTKRFFVLAATGTHYSHRLILECLYYNRGILNDYESVNTHVNFLFQIINGKLTSNADHLEQLTKAITKGIRYNREFSCPTIEIFETVISAVANDIAVGTFDMDLNEAALRVTTAASDAHQHDPPIDFHLFYVELNSSFRESKHFERSLSYAIVDGLCLIAKLPLTLKRIRCLIQRVMAIPHEQELRNVLFKLFQMRNNGLLSSIDPSDLYLRFERLLTPPTISSVHKTTFRSSFDLHCKYDNTIISIEQTLSSLEILIEGIQAIVLKKETDQDSKFSSLTSRIIEIIASKVLETDVNDKAKEITQMLVHIPPGLIPLIGRCLRRLERVVRHYYTLIENAPYLFVDKNNIIM